MAILLGVYADVAAAATAFSTERGQAIVIMLAKPAAGAAEAGAYRSLRLVDGKVSMLGMRAESVRLRSVMLL